MAKLLRRSSPDVSAMEDFVLADASLLEGGDDAREEFGVGAGEDAEADDFDVFLEGGFGDHFRGLADAGVDDFHAGVTQGARDDFGAAVVAVKAGLGDEDADGVRIVVDGWVADVWVAGVWVVGVWHSYPSIM